MKWKPLQLALIALGVAITALWALPPPAVAAPVTMRLANVLPPNSSKNKSCLEFAKLVDKYTNGQVKVQVFPGSQLGDERDLAQGVVLGTIDAFWGDAAVFGSYVKELKVFNTPFLFKDLKQWIAVVRGPVTDKMVAELEHKAHIKVVGRFQMGERYILTRDKPVRTPADLAGLKIRVPDVPMYVASFKALGAKATPMAYSEVYTSLQQGVIDGMENPAGLIRGMKFYEVTKYLTKLGWSNSVNFLVINGKVFDGLTPAQRQAVARAGHEAASYLDTLLAKEKRENFKFFADHGMTIIPVKNPAPWLAKLKDFPQKYGNLWGDPGLYTRIQHYKP